MKLKVRDDVRNFYRFVIEEEKGYIIPISFSYQEGIMLIEMGYFFFQSEKEYLPVIQVIEEQAIKKAKEWKVKTILWNDYQMPYDAKDGKEIRHHFSDRYQEKTSYLPLFLKNSDHYEKNKNWVYHLESNELQQFLSFVQIAEKVMQEKEKKEPTMTRKLGYVSSNQSVCFHLYYEGKKDFLYLENRQKEKRFVAKMGKKEKEIISLPTSSYEEKNWEEVWEKQFDKIYNAQRLKSVFEKPTKYTEENISLLAGSDKKGQTQMKKILEEKLGFREMEKLFARAVKNKIIGKVEEHVEYYNNKIFFSYIEDHLFVYDTNLVVPEDVVYFPLAEKEKALTLYQEKIITYQQKQLQRRINQANGRLNMMEKRRKKHENNL